MHFIRQQKKLNAHLSGPSRDECFNKLNDGPKYKCPTVILSRVRVILPCICESEGFACFVRGNLKIMMRTTILFKIFPFIKTHFTGNLVG